MNETDKNIYRHWWSLSWPFIACGHPSEHPFMAFVCPPFCHFLAFRLEPAFWGLLNLASSWEKKSSAAASLDCCFFCIRAWSELSPLRPSFLASNSASSASAWCCLYEEKKCNALCELINKSKKPIKCKWCLVWTNESMMPKNICTCWSIYVT